MKLYRIIFVRFATLVLLAGFSHFSFAGFNFPTANGYYRANECYETIAQLCVACDGRVSNGNTCTSVVVGSNACQVRNAQGNINGSTFSQSCSITCPAGQVRVNGICNAPPTCPAGKEYSTTTGECEWITSCPAGQSLLTTTSSGGAVNSAQCVPQSGNNFPCDTYARMQSSYCQSLASECKASGGTFGNLGAGGNVCIPAANNLPKCESGGTQYVTNPDGSSSPTCVGSSNIANPDQLPQGVEGNKTSTTSEQESAAATANNTAQIANINNQGFQSVVNAINNMNQTVAGGGGGNNGEGEGEGEENSGSGSASGQCQSPPTCSGDEIQCAILRQQWEAMCHKEEYDSEGDFYTPSGEGEASTRFGTLLGDFRDQISQTEISSSVTNFFRVQITGSCPTYSVDAWVFSIELDQWCSTDIPWDLIAGVIMAVALMISARIAFT